MNTTRHPSRPRRGGFTFVEMLLALLITGVIATVVAFMLYGVSSTTAIEHDARQANLSRQVAIARLGGLTRSARTALDVGANYAILWTRDANESGEPDLSELRLIQWNQGTGDVTVYEAPESLDPSSDVAYSLSDNFKTIVDAIAGSAVFPGEVALRHVTDWELTLDNAVAQDAARLRLRATLGSESGEEMTTIVSAFRASE